jgi:protein-tyrosine phosphatase
VLARPADAADLAKLRDAAAGWQLERGIEQWAPGEVSEEQFAKQAAAGEWYLVRSDEPIAALRLLGVDPLFWGDQPNCIAVYVHGLVTARTAAKGAGAALLRWVEDEARKARSEAVRLDCLETNETLRRYYEVQGYVMVDRKTFSEGRAVALYEKRLTGG